MCIPDQQHPVMSAHGLLCSSVLGPAGQYLGYVYDIVLRPRVERNPLVVGLLACLGEYDLFLPVSAITAWERDSVRISAGPGLRPLEDRDELLLLRSDLFDLWVTGPTGSRAVRIRELLMQHTPDGWVLTTSDARARLVRRLGRGAPDERAEARSGPSPQG